MTEKKHNPRNEKPISLHPLTLADALKQAMQVNLPAYEKANPQTRRRKASKKLVNPGEHEQAP